MNCRYLQIGLFEDISNSIGDICKSTVFLDISKWIEDISNWIGDIYNWFADIYNSIGDICKYRLFVDNIDCLPILCWHLAITNNIIRFARPIF